MRTMLPADGERDVAALVGLKRRFYDFLRDRNDFVRFGVFKGDTERRFLVSSKADSDRRLPYRSILIRFVCLR